MGGPLGPHIFFGGVTFGPFRMDRVRGAASQLGVDLPPQIRVGVLFGFQRVFEIGSCSPGVPLFRESFVNVHGVGDCSEWTFLRLQDVYEGRELRSLVCGWVAYSEGSVFGVFVTLEHSRSCPAFFPLRYTPSVRAHLHDSLFDMFFYSLKFVC